VVQGMVNTMSDIRKASSAFDRVRTLLQTTRAEPQVEAAIPPGEWWLKARRSNRSANSNGTGYYGQSPAGWTSENSHMPVGSVSSIASSSIDSGSIDGGGSAVRAGAKQKLAPWVPDAGPPGVDEGDIVYMQCPYPYRPMPDDLAMERAQGDIVCREVAFSYPMRPDVQVLQKVSFRLERGKMTALVGRSGAGKSTVVSLLSRFYAPESGTITMGGMDIFAWSRNAWAASVALVSQDPVLFAASIADNIAYGAPRASQESIEKAAAAANAHDFIMKFPDGCASHHASCVR
jgi:ABC-type multidrug transport system fused ATPase/permease subunit